MKARYIPNSGDNYNKQFIKKMIKQIDSNNVNIHQCKEMNELKKLKFQNFTFIYNEEDYINTNVDEKDNNDVCEMNYFRRRGIFNNNILNAFPVFINENETDKEINNDNDDDTKQHHLIIHRNQNTTTNSSLERNDTLKTKDKIYLPKIKVKHPGNYSCDKIRNVPMKNKMNINIKNESNYYQQNQQLKCIQDYNIKPKNNSALCKSKFFQYDIMNHILDTSNEQKENSFFSYTNKIRNLSLSNIHKNNKYHTRQNERQFNNNIRIPKKKYTTLRNINNNNSKARHYYYQEGYLNLPSLEISADYN